MCELRGMHDGKSVVYCYFKLTMLSAITRCIRIQNCFHSLFHFGNFVWVYFVSLFHWGHLLLLRFVFTFDFAISIGLILG